MCSLKPNQTKQQTNQKIPSDFIGVESVQGRSMLY